MFLDNAKLANAALMREGKIKNHFAARYKPALASCAEFDITVTTQPISMAAIVLHNRFEALGFDDLTVEQLPLPLITAAIEPLNATSEPQNKTASVSSSGEEEFWCDHCSSPTGTEYFLCLLTDSFHCEGCHLRLCTDGRQCMPCCRSRIT